MNKLNFPVMVGSSLLSFPILIFVLVLSFFVPTGVPLSNDLIMLGLIYKPLLSKADDPLVFGRTKYRKELEIVCCA